MIATPGLGRWAMQQGWIAKNILSRGNVGTPFTDGELDAYMESFKERSRALAVSHLYRYYQRALREGISGRWRAHRLRVPTRFLFGERDRYLSPRLLPGFEPYADDMEVELVPDSGHFVVDGEARPGGAAGSRALRLAAGGGRRLGETVSDR